MSTRAARSLALVAVLALVAAPDRGGAGPAIAGATLKRVATIELPGPPGGRFDYLAIDYDDRYLFSAHLGPGLLYVVDLRAGAVVKTISGLPGVEGIAYVPELRKVYTSNWHEDKIAVIDLARMEVVKKLPTAEKPDGIAYASPFHKAYVSDERGRAVAVIDVREDRILKTLRFPSETGVPQYDPARRLVYVNLQDRDQVAVIDPVSDTTVGRYPIEGCSANHGMALDPEGHLAFLSCEGNDTLTVFDVDAHRTVSHAPMAKGADVVQYDPGLRRVYAACASGSISVFEVDDGGRARKIEDVPVEKKVHSLALDLETHRVYAPEEEERGRPVARIAVFEAVASGAPASPR